MNAKEARDKAYQINSYKEKSQYVNIKKEIDSAVSDGKYECNIYERILPDVRTKLLKEGFIIVSEHFDQREGTTVTITW